MTGALGGPDPTKDIAASQRARLSSPHPGKGPLPRCCLECLEKEVQSQHVGAYGCGSNTVAGVEVSHM